MSLDELFQSKPAIDDGEFEHNDDVIALLLGSPNLPGVDMGEGFNTLPASHPLSGIENGLIS